MKVTNRCLIFHIDTGSSLSQVTPFGLPYGDKRGSKGFLVKILWHLSLVGRGKHGLTSQGILYPEIHDCDPPKVRLILQTSGDLLKGLTSNKL